MDYGEVDERGLRVELPACKLCCSRRVRVRYRLSHGVTTWRCQDCRLVFNVLGDGTGEGRELYGESYYREREAYYFRNKVFDALGGDDNRNLQDFREGLDLLASFRETGKLLDVGCGVGIFLALARERLWDVKGVDVSGYAVGCARERFGLDARMGTLKEVGFPDREFDCVTLWDAFEHLSDPVAQLEEIRRVLKDDGLLLLNTPNGDAFLRLLAHFLYRATWGKITYPLEKLFHEYHLYYYTRQTLDRMLGKGGFAVVWAENRPIPMIKARGSRLEKLLVGTLSLAERALGREYELWVLARKRGDERATNGR